MLLLSTGCSRAFVEDDEVKKEVAPTVEEPIYMSASIAVRAVQGDLASDSEGAEGQIAQLRILAFDSNTGKLAINQYYGNGQRLDFTDQTGNPMAQWRGAFRITPGKYNFFFIANEESWPTVKAALQNLAVGSSTVSEMYTNDAFVRIPYDQTKAARTFVPDAAISGGTQSGTPHLFLATRVYPNVQVAAERNGKGRSQSDPQHFLAEGDEKVELIRTLAKVKITFPKSATAEPDGNGGYRIKQFLPPGVEKIVLKNELPFQSLFLNPYFIAAGYPSGTRYTKDWYTNPTTDTYREFKLYDRDLTTNASETGLSVGIGATVNVTSATYEANRRYDCTFWFYVPENLLQAQTADPTTPGWVNGGTSLIFTKPGVSGESTFGIWQSSFTEGRQKVLDGASPLYYELPSAGNYSLYSAVRNNQYNIKVNTSGTQLMLKYEVTPWNNGGASGVYTMDAFNVSVQDPSFATATTNVVLSTTTQSFVMGDYIELKAAANFKFVVGGAEQERVEYGKNAVEQSFRAFKTIQLKSQSHPVAPGTALFEIYRRGKYLYTVTSAS